MNANLFKAFIDDESGQGITEYGAVLAFVTVLLALVISSLQGTMKTAMSQAFSTLASQIAELSTNAS